MTQADDRREGKGASKLRLVVPVAVFLVFLTAALATGDARVALTGLLATAVSALVAAIARSRQPAGHNPQAANLAAHQQEPECDSGSMQDPTGSVGDGDSHRPDEPAAPSFDIGLFANALASSQDPLAHLRHFVRDTLARHEASLSLVGNAPVGDADDIPSHEEVVLARLLKEAGALDDDIELPQVVASRHAKTGLVELRAAEQEHTYLAGLRIRALEAAIDTLQLADMILASPGGQSQRDVYRAAGVARSSITMQALMFAGLTDERGEWAIRERISQTLGSISLPIRAGCDFRVNAAEGNVSMAIELPPEAVFPGSEYVEGKGGVFPTTPKARGQMAADYGMRLALLFASVVFSASSLIKRVFVAGFVNSSDSSRCYYSVEFTRERFAFANLAYVESPSDILGGFEGNVRLEDGVLVPVERTFSLEERRFCPPFRWDLELPGERTLPEGPARRLRAQTTRDLMINEAARRTAVASEFSRSIGGSAEENVRAILSASAGSDDPTVGEAATRCVNGLIDGSYPDDETLADILIEEFVSGDEVTRCVADIRNRWEQVDPIVAINKLETVISHCDAQGRFADDEKVEWRSFLSYAERAVYNNVYALEGHEVRLVPRSYFEGHLALCMLQSLVGQHDKAIAHARRLVELSPVGSTANLNLAHTLEQAGGEEGVFEALVRYLPVAYDAVGLGVAYFILGRVMLNREKNGAAQACFARSLLFPSFIHAQAFVALASISELVPTEDGTSGKITLSANELDAALEEQGIPLAPSKETIDMLVDCVKAAVDAEVFPVARSLLMGILAFGEDESMGTILRSIEDCPDGTPY